MYGIDIWVVQSFTPRLQKSSICWSVFFLSGSMAKLQVETIFIVLIPVILALSISYFRTLA